MRATSIEEYAEMMGTPLYPAQLHLLEAIRRGETVKTGRRSGLTFLRRLADQWSEYKEKEEAA